MPYADIKNSSGEFVKPTLDSVTAALATANAPDDFRFSMTNPTGKDAYPIAGATWLLVYQQQKDATKGKKLVEFLKWHSLKARRWRRIWITRRYPRVSSSASSNGSTK